MLRDKLKVSKVSKVEGVGVEGVGHAVEGVAERAHRTEHADVHTQLQLLKAKHFRYPYVVATGRECATSRGSILVFQTLASAMACCDALNQNEIQYKVKVRWKVKRLDIRDLKFPIIFFEELVENKTIPTIRDYSRRDNMIWRRL
jgi:hypothetical protein